jgi:hypothetical protein
LYSIQQQQQQINFKLIQIFPREHSSDWITSIIQLNPNTLVSSSSWSSSPTDNVIVIWSKSSKSSSSSSLEYEPVQRITQDETRGSIQRLVLIKQKKEEEEEEVFASCSFYDHSVLIWGRRGKGGKGDKFQIKQKIPSVKGVSKLLYISQTNELIFGSSYPSLLHIWSSPSSSSSDFVKKQKIHPSSSIYSLCQLNENKNRIEFASGHWNGQIMIWSKQQINESNYSLRKTLKPFNHWVDDIIFINDNEFNFLISCSYPENKIVIYKGEEEEKEEEEHEEVRTLIPMSNGQFASGGWNQCLNIWSPSPRSSTRYFVLFMHCLL